MQLFFFKKVVAVVVNVSKPRKEKSPPGGKK